MDIRKRLGRKPDPFNHKDFSYSGPMMVAKLPKYSSLAACLTHVEDQMNAGSCTGQAGTLMMEMIRRHHKLPEIDAAALALYFFERMIMGTEDEDSGADMRTICVALHDYGVPVESIWTYGPFTSSGVPTKLFKKPPSTVFAAAQNYKLNRYERLTTLLQIKACIASSRVPVMIGFPVYESFELIGKDGIMPDPNPSREYLLGGHAVVIYAYDDRTGYVTIRNSWGAGWGLKGDFKMSYKTLSAQLASGDTDAWRGTSGFGI